MYLSFGFVYFTQKLLKSENDMVYKIE
jgi:hypothetical protein